MLFSLHPELNEITFETRWSGLLKAIRINDDGYSTGIEIFLPTWSEDTLRPVIDTAEEVTERLRSKAATVFGVAEEDIEEVVYYKAGFEGTVTRLRGSVDVPKLKPDVKAFVRILL